MKIFGYSVEECITFFMLVVVGYFIAKLFSQKYNGFSVGAQTTAVINDWLEVGILGDVEIEGLKHEIPIHIEKVLISDSLSTFSFIVDQKPTKAGIDPMYKFIDRDLDDNLTRVDILYPTKNEK